VSAVIFAAPEAQVRRPVAKLNVPIYTRKVAEKLRELELAKASRASSADGTGLALECGSFVRFFLEVEADLIRKSAYRSNGCGFALAAAEVLADRLTDRRLGSLHGLDDAELATLLGVDAVRAALADLRSRRVEEFRGETALVCSCFGVSEDAIAEIIRKEGIKEVGEVGRRLRAGTGCGSCRLVIREILEQVG
jgi:NifU-like protein